MKTVFDFGRKPSKSWLGLYLMLLYMKSHPDESILYLSTEINKQEFELLKEGKHE